VGQNEHRIVPAVWGWFEFRIQWIGLLGIPLAEGGAAGGSYAAQRRSRSAEWSRQQPQSNFTAPFLKEVALRVTEVQRDANN